MRYGQYLGERQGGEKRDKKKTHGRGESCERWHRSHNAPLDILIQVATPIRRLARPKETKDPEQRRDSEKVWTQSVDWAPLCNEEKERIL
jgi:hypothetical protein